MTKICWIILFIWAAIIYTVTVFYIGHRREKADGMEIVYAVLPTLIFPVTTIVYFIIYAMMIYYSFVDPEN